VLGGLADLKNGQIRETVDVFFDQFEFLGYPQRMNEKTSRSWEKEMLTMPF
jgi:hypothetical protein